MAKSKDNTYRDTKGKVTFVMFQVEGDDETLQQGFRAMEQAFQRLGPPIRTHTPLPGAVHLLSKADRPADVPTPGDEEELAMSQPTEEPQTAGYRVENNIVFPGGEC
jgi:hypothetical protein